MAKVSVDKWPSVGLTPGLPDCPHSVLSSTPYLAMPSGPPPSALRAESAWFQLSPHQPGEEVGGQPVPKTRFLRAIREDSQLRASQLNKLHADRCPVFLTSAKGLTFWTQPELGFEQTHLWADLRRGCGIRNPSGELRPGPLGALILDRMI